MQNAVLPYFCDTMSENHPVRRRRFQFGLGTIFVLGTVFSVWLGWELKYIRDGRAFVIMLDQQRQAAIQQSSMPVGTGMAVGTTTYSFGVYAPGAIKPDSTSPTIPF